MFSKLGKSIMNKTRDFVEDQIEDLAERREEKAEAEARKAAQPERESEGVVRDVIRTVTQSKRSPYLAEHTVQSGESLSAIAQRHYGNAGLWNAIYEANRDVLGNNPNVIFPGQELRIPRLDD